MDALFFGSLGTLGETSEIQRAAFNAAFAEAGLPWIWDRETYRASLTTSGGRRRIEAFAQEQGQSIDAEAIHRRKSEIFQQHLVRSVLSPRAGVGEAIAAARRKGLHLGLVTTTSRGNVDALLRALRLPSSTFEVIVTRADVREAKPAPDAFLSALQALNIPAGRAIAVEDNPDGATAALAAGLSCIVTPGAAHTDHVFDIRATVQDRLDLSPWLASAGLQRNVDRPAA